MESGLVLCVKGGVFDIEDNLIDTFPMTETIRMLSALENLIYSSLSISLGIKKSKIKKDLRLNFRVERSSLLSYVDFAFTVKQAMDELNPVLSLGDYGKICLDLAVSSLLLYRAVDELKSNNSTNPSFEIDPLRQDISVNVHGDGNQVIVVPDYRCISDAAESASMFRILSNAVKASGADSVEIYAPNKKDKNLLFTCADAEIPYKPNLIEQLPIQIMATVRAVDLIKNSGKIEILSNIFEIKWGDELAEKFEGLLQKRVSITASPVCKSEISGPTGIDHYRVMGVQLLEELI